MVVLVYRWSNVGIKRWERYGPGNYGTSDICLNRSRWSFCALVRGHPGKHASGPSEWWSDEEGELSLLVAEDHRRLEKALEELRPKPVAPPAPPSPKSKKRGVRG